MKKVLLLLCLLPMLVMAQTKKVAILETVDKEGKISYAHKLMLRSSLAKAITEADGYEGYDRVDLESVLGEHSFQRTGMVSDDQIKKLGEMVGAQYVLIAEAVMVDDATMFITAKIIDVETAQTMKTESQLMKATPQDIQIGCTTMAGNMLGIKLNAGITQSAASSKPASSSSSSSTPTPASTPKPAAPSAKITWNGDDDLSFRLKSCKAMNSKCYVAIALTNNRSKDMRIYIQLEGGYGSIIKVYDSDGGAYQNSNNGSVMLEVFKGSKLAGENIDFKNVTYTIPGGITIEFKLCIQDFDESASSIKLVQCPIKVDGFESTLEIRNIPVSRQ